MSPSNWYESLTARFVRGGFPKVLPIFVVATALLLASAGCDSPSNSPGNSSTTDQKPPVVERVVSADTIEVTVGEDTKAIRLRNIETPESTYPDAECLANEALAFTEGLLPRGEKVTLEYGEVIKDADGTDLAHVKLEDGRYVSVEIARAGLGNAVEQEGNDPRFTEVRDALLEASSLEEGLFDPEQGCTFAAQAEAVDQVLEEAQDIEAGASAADAKTAAISVFALAKSINETKALAVQGTALTVQVYSTVGRGAYVASVVRHHAAVKKVGMKFNRVKKKRAAAAKEAAQARKAADDAARAAAAAAAAAARRNTPRPTTGGSSGGGSSSPSTGYTGPRCYAPGGKTWKPC